MRRLLFTTAIFFLVFQGVAAQELIGSIGLSMQSMRDLKAYQNRYINNSTFVPLESTQSFPSYLQYQLSFRSFVSKKIRVGGTAYLTSTAARSATSDYSGEVRIDQKLWCFGAGGYFGYTLLQRNRWNVSAYAIPGLDLSRLKTTNTVSAPGIYYSKEESHADAISAVLECGFEFQYSLSDRLVFNANAGGHYSSPAMLADDYDQPVENVNWAGFKIMTGIGYRF